MGEAIGESLGYAIGIAVSPIPIAALILVLLSERPRTSSVTFTIGWTTGIAGVATAAILTPWFDAGDEPSDRRGVIRLTLGVLLVLFGGYRWRTRPAPGEDPPIPPLMRAVDGVGPIGVLGVGFVLAAFNPKDMFLSAAGGAAIGSADLTNGQTLWSVAIFTAIAASTAIIPVATYQIAGSRIDPTLARSKEWLIRHNASVMAVVLAAVGVLLIVEATQILTD